MGVRGCERGVPQVQGVAGASLNADKLAAMLEEDFDPAKFDAAMGDLYGDDFDEQDDPDFDPDSLVRARLCAGFVLAHAIQHSKAHTRAPMRPPALTLPRARRRCPVLCAVCPLLD